MNKGLRFPRHLRCVGCGAVTGVLHFNLLRVSYHGPNRRMRTRGAGAIDLCETCWSKATKASAIRRRPARPPARVESQAGHADVT